MAGNLAGSESRCNPNIERWCTNVASERGFRVYRENNWIDYDQALVQRGGNSVIVAFYEAIGQRYDDTIGLGKRLDGPD